MIFNSRTPMKKYIFLAIAFLAAAACTREQIIPEEPEVQVENGPVSVRLIVGSPETRTELGYDNGVLKPYWSVGDILGVTKVPEFDGDYANDPFTSTLGQASLTGAFEGKLYAGNKYFAYYPYTPRVGWPDGMLEGGFLYMDYDNGPYVDYVFNVPTIQFPSPTSFDKNADLLISKPFNVEENSSGNVDIVQEINLEFTRVNAIVKVVLDDHTGFLDGEDVYSITLGGETQSSGWIDVMKAPRTRAEFVGPQNEPNGLTGWADYELNPNYDLGFYLYDDNGIEGYVTAEYASEADGGKGFYTIGDDNEAAYFIVFPVIVKNDWYGGLPITIETEHYRITRTIWLPDDGIALHPSRVTTLNIGLYDLDDPDYGYEMSITEIERKIDFEKPLVNLLLSDSNYSGANFYLNSYGFAFKDSDIDKIEWSNSNEDVARVSFDDAAVNDKYEGDADGQIGWIWVQGLQDGETTVTATYKGLSASFKVKVVSSSPEIQFDDDNVKAICLREWDFNGDGLFTEFEASRVDALMDYMSGTGRNLVFPGTSIQSFDELRYFTGLKTLENAFINCKSLQSVQFPSTFDGDISWAFYGCDKLVSVGDLPEGMTEIGHCAFSVCGKLSDITLPSTIISIGDSAFNGCELLPSITLPEALRDIGSSAFWECKSLQSVSIPGGVGSISQNAFMNCTSLTSVTLSEGLVGINENAFYNCGMHEITFPSTLEWVNTNSFARVPFRSGHDGYTGITFVGTTPPDIRTRDYENNGNYTTFTGRRWNSELNEGAGDWTYGIQINVPAASLEAYSALSAIQNGGQNIIVGF